MNRKILLIDNAKYNNRLDLICYDNFGYFNETLLKKIIEINPSIDFMDQNFVGKKIELPSKLEIYL